MNYVNMLQVVCDEIMRLVTICQNSVIPLQEQHLECISSSVHIPALLRLGVVHFHRKCKIVQRINYQQKNIRWSREKSLSIDRYHLRSISNVKCSCHYPWMNAGILYRLKANHDKSLLTRIDFPSHTSDNTTKPTQRHFNQFTISCAPNFVTFACEVQRLSTMNIMKWTWNLECFYFKAFCPYASVSSTHNRDNLKSFWAPIDFRRLPPRSTTTAATSRASNSHAAKSKKKLTHCEFFSSPLLQ